MAVAEQTKFFVNFTGGLVTDSTRLNFPENAAIELDNMDIFRTGEAKRRLGADFENGSTLTDEDFDPSAIDTQAISMHEWIAINGKGDLNFLGVQIGSTMIFHDLGVDPLSSTKRGEIDLEPFAVGNGIPGDSLMDSSFGEGLMILTNPNMRPVTVEFNEDTSAFIVTAITIQIRDFDGVEDNLETSERPGELTDNHKYNLRNQGWPQSATVNNSRDGSLGVTQGTDPIEATKSFTIDLPVGKAIEKLIGEQSPTTILGVYPSNADIIYLATAPSAAQGNEEVIGSYSPFHLDDVTVGNTPAPKGHFIFNAFDQDRTGISGIPNLTKVTTTVRPSNTEFYAGRVWYAGVPDKNLAGDIFFSQSLTDIDNAGKCYQEFDPTAEDLNTLVATDGGVIHIADIGRVYKLITVGQDLVIVASNGIWAISGTDGGNFTATDFTLRKVSDIGTTSADSVLEADGVLYFWNKGGVYAVQSGQISNEIGVVRLTRDKIQDFFEDISEAGKAYVRGWYDAFDKKLYWFYNDTLAYDGISFRFKYNRVLVLDLTLQSFYPYTIEDLATNSPFVAGMTQKEPGSEDIITYDVVQAGNNVLRGADEVVEDIAFPVFTNAKLKMLTFVINQDSNYEYTFSEFKSRTFTDWITWDQFINDPANTGVDYSSVLQAGWENFGDPTRLKHITHINHFFNRTETGYSLVDGEIVFDDPSGVTAQMRWEWTDLDVGRWTKKQQAYRLNRFYIPEDETDPFDYGFEVVKTQLRARGKGHAFSLRYESETGKDFQLLGFAVNVRAGVKQQ